jgi:hypothetical protein
MSTPLAQIPTSDTATVTINFVGASINNDGSGTFTFQKVVNDTTDGTSYNDGAPVVYTPTDKDLVDGSDYTNNLNALLTTVATEAGLTAPTSAPSPTA